MAGPLVFWPNRKSKHGAQSSAKVPRAHRKPFATEPPVMKTKAKLFERPIDRYGTLDHPDLLAEMRSGMARDMPGYVEVFDLVLKHRDALASMVKVLEDKEALHSETAKVLDEAQAEIRKLESVTKENTKLREENEAKTADLRKLRDQIDEDKIQLRILYAVDEACAGRDGELKAARGEIAELKSRIAELESSKRKLRDALNRLSRDT